MSFKLQRSDSLNGVWPQLKSDWRNECEQADEDFDTYAQSPMVVLDELVLSPSKHVSVYLVFDEKKKARAIFQANAVRLVKKTMKTF